MLRKKNILEATVVVPKNVDYENEQWVLMSANEGLSTKNCICGV
jgi:hypothetical protein